MGCERNFNSIQELEKEIRKHEMAMSKLKRARNSLLNITLIPPEILGGIFYWTMVLQQEQTASRKIPHNLLFICHHWLEVALHTPELWTSWGDRLWDWERRHTCPGTSQLDLELAGSYSGGEPSEPLRCALQAQAAQDFIRRVHLSDGSTELLNSVISSITVGGDGVRSTSLESFKLDHEGDYKSQVELSNFFSRYNFPKLRHLRLSGHCNLSSWDLLPLRTTVLVTLSLKICRGNPTPTASQLLSILASNPNLQSLELSEVALPDFSASESSFQVCLPHLKKIFLLGYARDGFGLLNRLEPADKMDNLRLALFCHSTSDISQTLAWYLGDHVRRRGKLQKGLAVEGDCENDTFDLKLGDVEESNNPSLRSGLNWFIQVKMVTWEDWGPQGGGCDNLFFDSLAHIRDHVVYYQSPRCFLKSADLSIGMFNLIEIHIPKGARLSEWFVEPDTGGAHDCEKFLPSLRYLSLFEPLLDGGDWSPLLTFLSRGGFSRNRLDLLTIYGCPHMCLDVVENIRRIVRRFEPSPIDPYLRPCPHDTCT